MIFVLMALCLMGFTPIYTEHDTTEKIDREIENIEQSVQSKQFTVLQSTPNLSQLRDGEIALVSSGTVTRLMFREGQEIYSVNFSCVTVRR